MALFEIDTHARHAQDAGVVTAEAVAAWLAQLARAGQEGTFLMGITGFLVSASKG